VVHRTSKYLNNILEADHGALKRMIRPTRGFQTMKTAAATLTGFEVMRMIRPRSLQQAGMSSDKLESSAKWRTAMCLLSSESKSLG
jgi:transposase-like protein